MKLLVCVVTLLFASLTLADSALADSDADRTAIQSVIATLNDHTAPASTLFATDGADNAELGRLADLDRMLSHSPQPLSEVTAPRITVSSIRFITPDVALLDGINAQYGSVIVAKSVPVLLVMKREGSNWRVASFRNIPNALGPELPR
jgi:hypothetical protein